MKGCLDIRGIAAASLLWTAFAHAAFATGVEPAKDLQTDPAPCMAAVAANDDDKTISVCGALIDNEKTLRADRIKALIARAGAYDRKDMIDRAIDDYDGVLRLDPSQADVFNARGELWRKKGDRPKALQDFGAAIKLNPDHAAAKANYKSLAQELERLGALKAVAGKPSFNCAHRAARGGKGDLRQSGARRSRPRDQCRQYQGGSRSPKTRARRVPCSANRTSSSPAATPASAGPATICARRCRSGCKRLIGVDGY